MLATLLLFAAPGVPTLQGTDVLTQLRSGRDEAFERWVSDDVPGAMRRGARAVELAAAALAELGTEDGAELADEIELALVELTQLAREHDCRRVLAGLLAGVDIDPGHGSAHASLAWLRPDCADSLALLLDWELVGPFDNERGRGMKDSTPPESSPGSSEVYAGKLREVSWRGLPELRPARGIIDLGALVDPSDQICVLARSWVHSPDGQPALLMLGAAQELRLWLNGEVLFDALKEHRFREDAFCVLLPLRAGWNELALKVGSREGSPAFCARLARPQDGARLRLEHTAHAPPGVTPMPLSDARAPRRKRGEDPHRPGAWRRWASGEDAESLYRRSVLESHFRPRPESEEPGLDAARAATALQGEVLRYRMQHTLALHKQTAVSAEKDVNPWLASIEGALELRPDLPLALRWKAEHAWYGQIIGPRALELLDRVLEQNPESVPALDLRAGVLDGTLQSALAWQVRKRIAAHPDAHFHPRILWPATMVLPRTHPQRASIQERVIAANASQAAFRARAELRRSRGEDVPELETLDEILSEHPWSIAARLQSARQLLAADRAGEALGILAQAIALSPEHAASFKWKARAHIQLGDTEAAVAALERELELDFAADDERRLLEHLRSRGAVAFHEPYREPLEQILQRRADAPTIGSGDVSREVLLRRLVVEVHPDGTAKRYLRSVQRVLNESGARSLDRIPLYAHPGDQEVRVLRADVHKQDGSRVRARTGRGGERGGMWVDLPPLETGDLVDLEWRLDDLRTTYFGTYFGFNESFTPDPALPVYESEMVLLTTPELPLLFHTRNYPGRHETEALNGGGTRHRFFMGAIAPLRNEPLMPPASETIARVQASSYASWADFGRWWWNLIESEIRVSPEMAAKVAELTAGRDDPRERLRAIYDFVVTDIRYNAWEFGVHGYQPYSAPVIFSRGFGDCKDKAILLRAMLSEVDIEAFPVLIRSAPRREEEDHTLALVEHFNHCIAYVPEQEGLAATFLDGTARHHPVHVLPASDAGARVVVVRPDGVEETRIPFPDPGENRLESEFHVSVNAEGGARVELTQRPSGRFDPGTRARFAGSEEERQEEAERLLAGLFGAIAGEVESSFSDLEDLDVPVTTRLAGTPERVARPTASGFELPSSFRKLRLLRTLAGERTREHDLLLDVPMVDETTIDYELHAEHTFSEPPESVRIETPDASYSWAAEPSARGLRIRERFELKNARIPAERYARFRELCRVVDETQARFCEVEVKP